MSKIEAMRVLREQIHNSGLDLHNVLLCVTFELESGTEARKKMMEFTAAVADWALQDAGFPRISKVKT